MRQWREVKSRHRDALVFFRVGDFYEMFCDDAEEGARLLGLTLTTRNNGAAGRVPLAGIPVKALDEYLARLVSLGQRVAICEQMEDPAKAKGIVRREVVETVTPGTVLSGGLLDAKRNNFIVAAAPFGRPAGGQVAGSAQGAAGAQAGGAAGARVGVAALDVSTAELVVLESAEADLDEVLDRFEPREILVPESWEALAPRRPPAVLTIRPDWLFGLEAARDELVRRYRVQSLDGFGFERGDDALVCAAGAVVAYVEEIRPGASGHLRAPRVERPHAFMTLDSMTRRNLELVEPLRGGDGGTSLLSVLDATRTPMGSRLLRSWLLAPLVDPQALERRQFGVAELVDAPSARTALRDSLGKVRDLDRLATRIGSEHAGPRELLALGESARQLPALAASGAELESEVLATLCREPDTLADLESLVGRAISADAPATLADGGVIRAGFDSELDELRRARDGAQEFIAGLQAREREQTGIASLRVGFNKVFGYYLEVTKPNLPRVPPRFARRQTLTNAERFVTAELKEWEEKVFGAEDRIAQLEQRLFRRVRSELAQEVPRIRETARRAAALDVLAALAEVAESHGYVRPKVTDQFAYEVTAGRHPVVETVMPREDFIPNDLCLDDDGRVVILTGPNMAGKSTVLRQTGLIQIMAQMGSFVPAAKASLGICDRVFTRVGASDSLARGQSTFMVEMNETASIIHGAAERSLVLLDEIGRGTSTYDGVSIAWAVTEYLHEQVGAKTVFATHYHELTQLSDLLSCVKNLNVAVRESGDGIVFLRRLEKGGADRSYGIQVARLAGFPPELVARAAELLSELEGVPRDAARPVAGPAGAQMSLFGGEHPVLERLRALDPERMTPIEALNVLQSLRASAV